MMSGMRGGGESRAKRVKRWWLGPALGRSMEAQGPLNHPMNDGAHLPVSQMPDGHDSSVMRHLIDHTIEVLGTTHVAGSPLRRDRCVNHCAQKCGDRARRPNDPGL